MWLSMRYETKATRTKRHDRRPPRREATTQIERVASPAAARLGGPRGDLCDRVQRIGLGADAGSSGECVHTLCQHDPRPDRAHPVAAASGRLQWRAETD